MTPLEITLIVVVVILALLLLGAIIIGVWLIFAFGELMDGIIKAVWK